MIIVDAIYLKSKDVSMVKKYARYVLNKFVRRSIIRKTNITIRVVDESQCDDQIDIDDLKRYKAWCTYDKVIEGKKYFTVILNKKSINKKAKTPHVRLKNLLIDLGHELVHVKQYLNGEIFDYKSGDVRYKGSYFDSSYQQNEELYYDSPWEVEAYGREWGLYKMFVVKMYEERLSK